MRYAISLVGSLLVLSACKTDAVREDVPARVTDPGPASHAELQRAVGTMLNAKDVTIADSALSDGSLLIIEPSHLMGRDLRRPEQFQLVLSGSGCVLVHLETDARIELSDVNCTPE